ncbi:GatB/YqeY domain-containing protein [Corynebacterium sp. H128]|uniref:GatB/YqeY domain-containing protein n=1 Tax=Corynebacterium sp. H128 TaxID=3133427 RepID=UPI00309CF557
MSDLKNQIRADLKEAMKAREKQRTNTLRMLLAAIQTEEVSGTKHEIDDEAILKLIAREIKKRKESAEVYANAGRQELADNEQAEAEILAAYQPQQLTDEELAALVASVIAGMDEPKMGPVMQAATKQAAGRVDGKRLSTAVRAALS